METTTGLTTFHTPKSHYNHSSHAHNHYHHQEHYSQHQIQLCPNHLSHNCYCEAIFQTVRLPQPGHYRFVYYTLNYHDSLSLPSIPAHLRPKPPHVPANAHWEEPLPRNNSTLLISEVHIKTTLFSFLSLTSPLLFSAASTPSSPPIPPLPPSQLLACRGNFKSLTTSMTFNFHTSNFHGV